MLEHIFVWTCDQPGCDIKQYTYTAKPADGWVEVNHEDDKIPRHCCRKCAIRLNGKGDGNAKN